MNSKLLVLSVAAVLTVSVVRVESCSCQWMSADRHYCESDFVVLAVAKNQSQTADDFTVYDIDLWRIYRSRNGGTDSALMTKQLWSRTADSLCGIQLTLGEPYILSGFVIDSKPRISVCGYNQIWSDMSVEEENGITTEYKKICDRLLNSARYTGRMWYSSK